MDTALDPSLPPTDASGRPSSPGAGSRSDVSSSEASLLRCVNEAFHRAVRMPRLWLSLWLLNLGLSVLCGVPLLIALATQLLDRPLADAMARGQADAALLDLLLNGSGVAAGVVFGIVGALLVHWLASVALSAGLLRALLPPGHRLRIPTDAVLHHAAAALRPSFRLEVLALLGLRLPLLVLCVLAAALVGRGQRPLAGSVTLLVGSYAPIVGVGLWLWSALSLAIQVARLQLLSQSAAGASAYRILRATLRSLWAAPGLLRRVAALSLLSIVAYAVLIVGARLGAAALDYRLFVGLAFGLRQLAAMARSVLALFQLATAGELWQSQADSEAQTRL